MALDQPAVPIREKCGLGQISGYVVSNASVLAIRPGRPDRHQHRLDFRGVVRRADQGLPEGGPGGRYGPGDTPSVLQPETKDEFGAEAQGWKVVDFLEPPISVENWAPYVEQYQQKGVTALWPADNSNFTPFAQAMTTAGYHPAFVFGDPVRQLPDAASRGSQPHPAPGLRRDAVVAARAWPRRIPRPKSSSPSCTNTPRVTRSTSTTKREPSRGSCGPRRPRPAAPALTVTCVLNHAAATTNWDAGGIQAPIAKLDALQREPPALTVFRHAPVGPPRGSSTTRSSPLPRSPSGTATPRTSSS